jgi:hypothetical protein
MPSISATLDPTLHALVRRRCQLFYQAGADPRLDRPAHVRAASSLAWFQGRLVAVQDDANFVAAIDPHSGRADAWPLPAGALGRRLFGDAQNNKHHKLDLEAAVVVRDQEGEVLLALGSGSTPRREKVAVVRGPALVATLVDASDFYAGLRTASEFSGSELNLEGAVAAFDSLYLFQRGNGAPRGALLPTDATCTVSVAALLAYLANPDAAAAPAPTRIQRYDLGRPGGARLTFTDAAWIKGRLWYTAAAEASPDVTRDGEVCAVALGLLEPAPRYTLLTDEHGPVVDKVEGLAEDPDRPGWLYAVVDRDDPDAPAELLHIEVSGPGT